MTAHINIELILKAVHACDELKVDNNGLAAALGVSRWSLYRNFTAAQTLLGIEFARAREVPVMYVKTFGLLNPEGTRDRARKLVASQQPGAHRKGMILRKVTP